MKDILQKILKEPLKEVEGRECALMFTGGFDSVLLALLLQQCKAKVTAVTVQFDNFNPRTIKEATETAYKMGLTHHILPVTLKEFLKVFPVLSKLLYRPVLDLDLVVVYAALKKYDRQIAGRIFVSGMGSDQYLGSTPFKQDVIDEETHQQAAKMQGCKFIFPFLSKKLKDFSQQVSPELKRNKKLF